MLGDISRALDTRHHVWCNKCSRHGISTISYFLRVHFKEAMIKGAPPCTVGDTHTSGRMTTDNFLKWMQHFITYTHSSVANPVLLFLDNHESHISIESLGLANDNGIVMVTFPPHYSHQLQYVDRSVRVPLRSITMIVATPGRRATLVNP